MTFDFGLTSSIHRLFGCPMGTPGRQRGSGLGCGGDPTLAFWSLVQSAPRRRQILCLTRFSASLLWHVSMACDSSFLTCGSGVPPSLVSLPPLSPPPPSPSFQNWRGHAASHNAGPTGGRSEGGSTAEEGHLVQCRLVRPATKRGGANPSAPPPTHVGVSYSGGHRPF